MVELGSLKERPYPTCAHTILRTHHHSLELSRILSRSHVLAAAPQVTFTNCHFRQCSLQGHSNHRHRTARPSWLLALQVLPTSRSQRLHPRILLPAGLVRTTTALLLDARV